MAGSNRSITQHPLFPALVTMWFGATFGLCSLVIGKPTLEAWIVASGLPEFLASARPPLGSTARVLLALAACGVGSLLGLALAAMLVRAKSPDEQDSTPYADEPIDDTGVADGRDAEIVPALPSEPEHEVAVVAAESDQSEAPDPAPDALAQFLRSELSAMTAESNAPRAPFSVFDELGPDAGIASAAPVGPETDRTEIQDADAPPGDREWTEAPEHEDQVEDCEGDDEIAPDFAGSPPLPSNVHAIDAARLAQHALPTRFANDPEPEQTPAEGDRAPDVEEEDLGKLSYLQLTERLAKAIAKNPHPPASLRRRGAAGGASTAVNSPGLERLRRVHARTEPANESATPDADQIRDALTDLRNIGGAA